MPYRSATPDAPPATGVRATERALASNVPAVYEQHADDLYALALLLCGEADTANEVMAGTLARECMATAVGADPDGPRPRMALDVWRKCAPQGHADATDHPEQQRPSTDADARAVLGLVLFGCHTYQQAAAVVGLPLGSAARQLHRALCTLRSAGAPPHGLSG